MKHKRYIALVLSFLIFATIDARPKQEQSKSHLEDAGRITPEEVKRARDLADRFIKRFRETRDLTPIVDEMFTGNFKKMVAQDTSWSGIVGLGISLIEHLDGEQRSRCFVLGFSLQYMIRLYIAGKVPLDSENLGQTGDIFPPKIIQFIKDNAPPEEEIETTEQALAHLSFLEQVTLLMREEVAKNPPEETEQFKQNLIAFEAHFDEHAEEKPSVMVYSEDRHGLPAGTRLIRMIIPFHVGLAMIDEKGELKIDLAATHIPPR